MKVQENDSLHLPSGHLQRRDSMNSPSLAEVYSPRVIDEDIAQSNFNGREPEPKFSDSKTSILPPPLSCLRYGSQSPSSCTSIHDNQLTD